MSLLNVESWLRTPPDRAVIARWTPDTPTDATNAAERYRIALPDDLVPNDGTEWEFLALGDTGDADAAGPGEAPQDAVAVEMARSAVAPVGGGQGRFVVHTGDVIYLTGERRLYERNFRRPYAALLTAESTVDNLVFRIPFLPVPGNHDYYDLRGWATWLSRVPLIGSGLRALSHKFFSFSLPKGGSDMGAAYMNAFVQSTPKREPEKPVAYLPGKQTRLPNRYYTFTVGNVDFFALDSNTLDAPSPGTGIQTEAVRESARARVAELERRAEEIDAALKAENAVREQRDQADRAGIAGDPTALEALRATTTHLESALGSFAASVETARGVGHFGPVAAALAVIHPAQRQWRDGTAALEAATTGGEAAETALARLDIAGDAVCAALTESQNVLAVLTKAEGARAGLLTASSTVEKLLTEWTERVHPQAGSEVSRSLSEDALDIQREIAMARRREEYQPEDFDSSQIDWFDAVLHDAQAKRPDNWRIVFLHHPLYTTITNHCERPDVLGLRANLLASLQGEGRVHLILSGHSHSFEWLRSRAIPLTGLFVTGGGGQISLRPTLLEPRRWARHRGSYDALRRAGVEEAAVAGRGPTADDGASRSLYHFLRIRVLPDSLRVCPVGVRAIDGGRFRREEPMPVFHIPELVDGKPERDVRRLSYVEIRRDEPPTAHWAE